MLLCHFCWPSYSRLTLNEVDHTENVRIPGINKKETLTILSISSSSWQWHGLAAQYRVKIIIFIEMKSERLVFFFSFVDFISVWYPHCGWMASYCSSMSLCQISDIGEERDGNAAIVSVYHHFLLLVSQSYSQPEVRQPAASFFSVSSGGHILIGKLAHFLMSLLSRK